MKTINNYFSLFFCCVSLMTTVVLLFDVPMGSISLSQVVFVVGTGAIGIYGMNGGN